MWQKGRGSEENTWIWDVDPLEISTKLCHVWCWIFIPWKVKSLMKSEESFLYVNSFPDWDCFHFDICITYKRTLLQNDIARQNPWGFIASFYSNFLTLLFQATENKDGASFQLENILPGKYKGVWHIFYLCVWEYLGKISHHQHHFALLH